MLRITRTPAPLLAVAAAAAFATVLVAVTAGTAAAQELVSTPRRWEFRLASGALLPEGAERTTNDETISRGSLTAAQLSWKPSAALAITGTFGFARTRAAGTPDATHLNVFVSDLGLESHAPRWFDGRAVTLAPFVGFGMGARSYDVRGAQTAAVHNLAGYGAVGGELGAGRLRLRVEVREYVSGGRIGSAATAPRTDRMVITALRLVRRADAR